MMAELSGNTGPEEIDIVPFLREAIRIELAIDGAEVMSLGSLLGGEEGAEILSRIYPAVQQRMIDQGHDFDSLDVAEALLDDEEGDEGFPQPPNPDSDPDDDRGDGGSRIPRVRIRPPDGSAGAEVPVDEETLDEGTIRESYFPAADPSEPLHRAPRVPVGSLFNSEV